MTCLSIWLDGLCARHAEEIHPNRQHQALILFSGKVVVDANAIARERGTKPGQALIQAKTVWYGEADFIEFVPSAFRDLQTKWLDRLLRYTDSIEPRGVDRAFVDLSRHPRPIEIADLLLRDLLDLPHLRTLAGFAPGTCYAQLAMEEIDRNSLMLGIRCLEDWSDPTQLIHRIPVSRLHFLLPETREKLTKLGYTTLQNILRSPVAVVVSQFGEEGRLMHHVAAGNHRPAVRAQYPLQSIPKTFRFEGACQDSHACKAALAELAKQIALELRIGGWIANQLFVEFLTEQSSQGFDHSFPKGAQSTGVILAAAIQKFDGIEWSEEGLTAIRMIAHQLTVAKHIQKTLQDQVSKSDRQAAAMNMVTATLQTFGSGALKKATDIQVPRRIQVLRAWKQVTGWN